MKVFNYVFGVLFIISAALQYNDPDPYVWITIYLFAALMCFSAARGILYPKLYWAAILILALYAIFLFFDENGTLSWLREHNAENIAGTMKADKPWIEETREFFGLLIVILVLVVNIRFAYILKCKYSS